MKRIGIVIFIILLISCGIRTIKAQNFTLPTGKYLVMFVEKSETEAEDKILMELTAKGILQFLYPDADETLPIAKLEHSNDKTVDIESIPFFDDLSGDYTYEYLAKGCFQLMNDEAKIVFIPFIDEEIAVNNAPEMEGHWSYIGDDEEINLDFRLPNIVKIEHREGYETTKRNAFWFNQVNGEDITITAIIFSNDFAGTLKQVRIENQKLYFNYKGKAYEMNKVNK